MGFNLLSSIAKGVETYAKAASKAYTSKDMSQYCSLDCAVGLTKEDIIKNPDLSNSPYILVDDNRSMITAFDLQGTQSLLTNDEFDTLLNTLRIKLNGYLNKKGHQISISFERDPQKAEEELMRLVKPQLESAKRMGIDAQDILLDRVNRNAPYVAFEQNFLVVFTHMNVFTPDEQKKEIKNSIVLAQKADVPPMEFSQNPLKIIKSMKVRHDTILNRIESDLSSVGIIFNRVSSKKFLTAIKTMLNRDTGSTFVPFLIGDKFYPSGNDLDNDYSNYFFPKIKHQLCSGYYEILNREVIKVNEMYHGNFSMFLAPQETQYFTSLFNNIDKTSPWRIKIDILPNGLDYFKGRRMMLAFTSIFQSNKDIDNAFRYLQEESRTQSICTFKVTFSTWSSTEQELIQRVNMLEKSVQSWGVSQTNMLTGDALLSWASTIPAFSDKNVGNRLIGPLEDVLSYLPLQRPATPWAENGNLILRTPDGKIYPVGLGSSLQDTWITLITAPPGSGKSVLMNSMNSASTFSAGNKELPLKTIIDVGESSFGYVYLIRDLLPENRKHEAIAFKLQDNKKYAVNPFDTQLGCRYPTSRERSFNVDFLDLLCADSSGKSPEGTSKLCTMLIDIAYKNKDLVSPNSFEFGIEIEIDEVLEKFVEQKIITQEWISCSTWYEITDILFKNKKIKEAGLAQRHASPILPDFSAFINDPSIQQIFGEARTSTQEPLLSYVNRSLITAASTYSLFNGVTKFEISSETKLIAIDVGDVIGNKTPEGKIRTAIMYLFARQLAAKNYFLKDEVILPVCPDLYKEYHLERVNQITSQKKTISYDETHNVKGITMFEETMLKDGREGRKWGIEIMNASQYLTDHSAELRSAATTVFIMKGGNEIDNTILVDEYKLSTDIIRRLNREAVGPRTEGGTLLAIFKTKVGKVVQFLTNTIGPIELWAFSTTLEDVSLRKKMTDYYGSAEARKILAKKFPTGTAIKYIEKISQKIRDSDTQNSVIDFIFEQIIDEYKKD